MEAAIIRYMNCEPTEEADNFLRHELNSIAESSPSDAAISFQLSKSAGTWMGELKVISGSGDRFLASHFSTSEIDAITNTLLAMREDLERWAHTKHLKQ